jgi:hypothetical protein
MPGAAALVCQKPLRRVFFNWEEAPSLKWPPHGERCKRNMATKITFLAKPIDHIAAQTQKERASDLAEGTVDGLSDELASGADVKDRKSQLINGPAEFRDTRVDND